MAFWEVVESFAWVGSVKEYCCFAKKALHMYESCGAGPVRSSTSKIEGFTTR